jgi:hypothetical protein
MMRAGKIVGSEVTDPLESAIELRDKIQRGQEKLFQMSIYVAVRADSLEELNKTTKLLEATLSARLFYSKVARYQQLEALQSILPRGEDLDKKFDDIRLALDKIVTKESGLFVYTLGKPHRVVNEEFKM